VDRTLIQEILEVVEQAGIASAKLTGLGLKNEADAAAVEAMRERMYKIQMQGRIVIGEGERDEAPMLFIGEKVGIVGQGWSATWKQNKASVKTDWEKVAETLQAVAPDTYAEAVKRLTQEKAGARVFRFRTEEVDK